MKRTSFAPMACSLAQALERVGDWWSPLILRDLFLGVDRFDDLVENLGISRNALAARLKALTADGIIRRQDRAYALTEAGLALVPILAALAEWGDRFAPAGPPMLFGHDCGGGGLQVTCRDCGQPVLAGSLTVRPGPGGRAGPGTRVIAGRLTHSAGRRPPAP